MPSGEKKCDRWTGKAIFCGRREDFRYCRRVDCGQLNEAIAWAVETTSSDDRWGNRAAGRLRWFQTILKHIIFDKYNDFLDWVGSTRQEEVSDSHAAFCDANFSDRFSAKLFSRFFGLCVDSDDRFSRKAAPNIIQNSLFGAARRKNVCTSKEKKSTKWDVEEKIHS